MIQGIEGSLIDSLAGKKCACGKRTISRANPCLVMCEKEFSRAAKTPSGDYRIERAGFTRCTVCEHRQLASTVTIVAAELAEHVAELQETNDKPN